MGTDNKATRSGGGEHSPPPDPLWGLMALLAAQAVVAAVTVFAAPAYGLGVIGNAAPTVLLTVGAAFSAMENTLILIWTIRQR